VVNFVQEGKTLPLVMTADVASGQLVIVGSFAGVTACAAKAGETVECALDGVFTLPKTPADAITQGQVVKATPAGVIDATGATAVGIAAAAVGAGAGSVDVRLTQGLGVAIP
jgi:predicted RecA/RadA family phage recombinase